MRRWILKTMLQRAISWLPQSYRWNGLFQRYITKGLDLTPARFDAKLTACQQHLDNLFAFRPHSSSGFTVVEFGTGWFPIVPIGLFLCGASQIRTYDIAPLLTSFTLRQTLQRFREYERNGRLAQTLPWILPERLASFLDVASKYDHGAPALALAEMGIRAIVNDFTRDQIKPGSTDFVFSTVSLEHLRRQQLTAVLYEFRRICSGDAVMSHYIGLADQFASFDTGISPFNFLQYSERVWRVLDNPVIPQGRLRISDYRLALKECGFRIVRENTTSGSIEELRRVRLAPEFRAYAEEDLLVLYAWLVAQPAT